MNWKACWFIVAAGALFTPSTAVAVYPRPRTLAFVEVFGPYLAELFDKSVTDRRQKIEVNVEHGLAFYEFDRILGHDMLLALPVKALREDTLIKKADGRDGTPLCELFLTQRYQLVAGGKPADRKKLRFVRFVDVDGLEKEAATLLATVRDVAGGGSELCLFGTSKEPILTTKFQESQTRNNRDFDLVWRQIANDKLSVVIALFGKHAATFEVSCVPPAVLPDFVPALSTFDGALVPRNRSRKAHVAAGDSKTPGQTAVIQFNSKRSGYFRDGKSLPHSPRIVWKYPPGPERSTIMLGDPIAYEGIVYFGDSHGRFHALDAESGTEKWVRACGPHKILAAPTVAAGKIYLASTGEIKCLSLEDGHDIWTRSLPESAGETWPLVVGDTLFAAGGDGVVCALKRGDGDILWRSSILTDRLDELPGFEWSTVRRPNQLARPASTASDGETLFQNVLDQSRVVAFDSRTGKQQWFYRTRGWVYSHPTVAENYVLFGSEDLYLYCVDRKTGKLVWRLMTGGVAAAAPAVAHGCVYCVSCNGRVICADLETGKQAWVHRLDPAFDNNRFTYCAPIVTDETVYVAMGTGSLSALDAVTGEMRWEIYATNTADLGSYNLATDGRRLFVVSRERYYRPPSGNYTLFALGD